MRHLAWFAGGFGAACLAACYLTQWWWLALPAAAVLAAAELLRRRTRPQPGQSPAQLRPGRRRVFHTARRCVALCLGALVGLGWFTLYDGVFRAPARDLAGTTCAISGTVSSYPRETSIGGSSLTVRLDGDFRAPDVLLYGGAEWSDLKPGDRVSGTARLKAADFMYGDETTYYTAKGIYLIAYCDDPPQVVRAQGVPFRYWPALCARSLREGIYAAFDDTAAPLAAAVVLGDKTGLDEQLASALNRSGVMHVAVVSGMHISFLVSVLLVLCRGRRGVVLTLLPLLIFFALMAGGTPSAFRAVITQCVLLSSALLRRENDPPSALGLALLILLVQNPMAAASVSLQLSFASVAGILAIAGRVNEGMLGPGKKLLDDRQGRLWRVVWQAWRFVSASVSASLGAMLFTTPLIAWYFHQITLISPLTNILVLWAVTALMISALVLGILAVFLPGIAAVPGGPASLLGHYIRAVVMTVGTWPLAALDAGQINFQLWLGAVYLQLPVLFRGKKTGRRLVLFLVCSALLLGAAIGLNHQDQRDAQLTVTALDVGQGASTLLLSGEGAVLVDCGGNGSDNAGDVAADHLAAGGRTGLELLVLTHLDDDHFNGVAQLFHRLDIAAVALPAVSTHPKQLEQLETLVREEGAELRYITEQTKLSFGLAELTLYPPMGQGTSNEEGLFALCSSGAFDVLITGDADSFVERMLVKYLDLPDLELLMVGHHGAGGSTCSELLQALRPELAVISVGYNSYGHPAQQTLDRLEQAGAQVHRTDLSGHVTVRVEEGRVTVTD